jgi:hypothetical protein
MDGEPNLSQPPLGGSWFYYRFERFTINPPALPEVTEFRRGLKQ